MIADYKIFVFMSFVALAMIGWSTVCSAERVEGEDINQPDLPIRGAPDSDRVGMGTRYDAELLIAAVVQRQIARVDESPRQSTMPGTLRGGAPRPKPIPEQPQSRTPAQSASVGTRATERALNLSRREKQAIQAVLTDKGYDTRGVDGIFGNNTRTAIRRFQRDTRLAATGYLSVIQLELLIK